MLSSNIRFSSKHARYPYDLLIIRNGASNGSVFIQKKVRKQKLKKDDISSLEKVHNSKWRLTRLGILEAKTTGKWISENFPNGFNAYMTGESLRSMETACYLNLKNAEWVPSLYLMPRDFGVFGEINQKLNINQFQKYMKEKSRDSFYWTPPNGESIAHLTLRTERVMQWIRKHVPENGSAIIVTHKDVMESLRIIIERISQMDYSAKIADPPNKHILHYCSILHYTRRNPQTGEISPNYKWMRILTPWLGKRYVSNKFEIIEDKIYGNQELKKEVSTVPYLFSHEII